MLEPGPVSWPRGVRTGRRGLRNGAASPRRSMLPGGSFRTASCRHAAWRSARFLRERDLPEGGGPGPGDSFSMGTSGVPRKRQGAPEAQTLVRTTVRLSVRGNLRGVFPRNATSAFIRTCGSLHHGPLASTSLLATMGCDHLEKRAPCHKLEFCHIPDPARPTSILRTTWNTRSPDHSPDHEGITTPGSPRRTQC